MNASSKLLATAIAGAAVGAATALLFAPGKGSETRKKLMTKVRSAKGTLDGYLADGEDSLSEAIRKGKQTVSKEV